MYHRGQKRCLIWFQLVKIYWDLICDPRSSLSWRMFHMHLRRRCSLLHLEGMSGRYQWDSSHLMFHLRLVFPCYFCLFVLFWWYIHWCELGVKVSYYYCVTGSVSINVVSVCLRYWGVLCIGCIDIHNCYVFLLDWSVDRYVVSSFVFCSSLYFKACLSDRSIASLVFCWFLFAWNTFSISSLSVCMCP